MKTLISKNRKSMRMFVNILGILVILALAFPVTSAAQAAPNSPFVGKWEAVDVDGSDMSLAIGGPASGPFQLTWTDKYISFCNGEAGIIRGTGWLNEADPNLLEADVLLECFTTGESLPFHVTFRYHPATNTLSLVYSFGQVTIWHRPGGGQAQEPPALGLRVNYGHDWVESFYEEGHTAWITVTDGDGNVKATAELVTEPKDFWSGETGFTTAPENWNPAPPDIQPYDWVYAWVDNGASAQVQIGEIGGTIDLENNSIEGTIMASWITDPVQVECLDWGSGQEPPFDNKDGGSILPDGSQAYACSWSGEWNIQPGQDVGVGYFGPDGHWVANAFHAPQLVLYIHYEYPDVVEGSYELGHTIQIIVFDSDWNTKATATVDTMEMPHWGGAPGFRVEQWDEMEGPPDIQPGNVVRAVVDGGLLTTEVQIGEITGMIDLDANSITGTVNAPWAGDLVSVLCMPWGAPEGVSEKETTVVPNGTSEFTCTWDSSEWDIQPGGTVGISYWGNDLHWVANEVSNPWILAFPEANQVFGYGWPVGSEVNLTINDQNIATMSVQGAPWNENDIMAYFDFNGIHDLVPGDEVMLSGSGMVRTHTVQDLAVTDVSMETDAVSGTAAPGATVHAWVHEFGQDVQVEATTGTWQAYFGSDEFHLSPGMCGRASIRVEGDNSTNVDWCIPNPEIRAWLGNQRVEGYRWPVGEWVSLEIYDAASGTTFSDSQQVIETEWGSFVEYFLEGWALQPGQEITMTGGGIVKSHTILPVSITSVDTELNTVEGTASGDGRIILCIYDGGCEPPVEVSADSTGYWQNNYGDLFDIQPGFGMDATEFDDDGDGTSFDYRVLRTVTAGNFHLEWSQANPEEIVYLSWKGSGNLTNSWANAACPDDLEFFGNSWISENEGTPGFFFASLVGWGSTGAWSSLAGSVVNIGSISSGCPGSADIPISTRYQFFDEKPDLMMIQRTFEFGAEVYPHDLRPFIPRLYPWNGFTQVLHPDAAGDELVTGTTCDFGCVAESWDGSWFAIHNPVTGQGMIVHSTSTPTSLWLDNDGGSFTNSSSILLLQPDGGFTGTVTETEYLCFYDSGTWNPSLTLPEGCQP